MGRYEVQVKDSFDKARNLSNGDMGGIIDTSPLQTNSCAKPSEWQHYVIEFRTPQKALLKTKKFQRALLCSRADWVQLHTGTFRSPL